MVRRPLLALPAALALALSLVACEPDGTTTTPGPTGATEPTGTQSPGPAPGEPDPLVPYSPSPSELVPRTTGFVPETLTLPTADGGTLLVSVGSTAIKREYTGTYRAMSVWATFENPGEEVWTGIPAAFAKIGDEAGEVFEPIANPRATDLHPNPGRYDASNKDLSKRVTIPPGGSVHGVIVFHPTGGNRFITISISTNGGGIWGEWDTTMGPF